MKTSFLSLIAIGCSLLASCNSGPDVVVTDRAGLPVAGAVIVPSSPSFNYPAVTTDGKGEANIPKKAVQEVKWLDVTVPGSEAKARVDYTNSKPVRVTLAR
ncbi:hypothetical protein [Luteolibacter sp. Populi]|uniref:hypothetical protein n=1 Tax=Luteolibacter sp. Populi TaxID=3230487 RepID=UPI00346633EF